MRTAKLFSYIPEPQPVKSDYLIAAHYYPGWKKGMAGLHNGFKDLVDYPERTPLLGYYDEENPEVCDWEIKWAVEHGIGCFIYCWYRKRENVGHPVTVDDIRLSHAIHEAYFNCRFKKYMKFAIMWECDWGLIQDMDDLVNNLLPFWVENYFKDEQYMTIDGKPVLYIYDWGNLLKKWGTLEKVAEIIETLHDKIKEYGFPGLHISGTHCTKDIYKHDGIKWVSLDKAKESGFDSMFQYCWEVYKDDLTETQYEEYLKTFMLDSQYVMDDQIQKIKDRIAYDPYFCMYTATCMRDSKPWFKVLGVNPRGSVMQMRLTPMEFKGLLIRFKEAIDTLPENSIGRKIVIIDNWNEWAEGHYVAPSLGTGFQYLEAIRDILTYRDNLPDYRVPEMLDMGPYDSFLDEI